MCGGFLILSIRMGTRPDRMGLVGCHLAFSRAVYELYTWGRV